MPGETVLIVASIYAGAGRLNVVAVGIIGFAAALIGDNIGFALGHFGGRALALRLGRYVRLTEERLDRAALGAALWAGTWVSLGYLAGSRIGTIYHYISVYSWYVLIALAMVLTGYIAWRVLRRRRRHTR